MELVMGPSPEEEFYWVKEITIIKDLIGSKEPWDYPTLAGGHPKAIFIHRVFLGGRVLLKNRTYSETISKAELNTENDHWYLSEYFRKIYFSTLKVYET